MPGTAAEQGVQLFELEKVRDELRLAKQPASATESRKFQKQLGARHDGEVTELVTELTARTEAKFYDDGYQRDHGLSLSREAIALGEQYETIVENSFLSPTVRPAFDLLDRRRYGLVCQRAAVFERGAAASACRRAD